MYNNTLGYHTDDVPATFMAGDDSWGWEDIANRTEAKTLQEFITRFVDSGNPNSDGGEMEIPYWPIYGEEATLLDFNMTTIVQARDLTANRRCDWWQKGLFF